MEYIVPASNSWHLENLSQREKFGNLIHEISLEKTHRTVNTVYESEFCIPHKRTYSTVCGEGGKYLIETMKMTQECSKKHLDHIEPGAQKCSSIKFIGTPGEETSAKNCEENQKREIDFHHCFIMYPDIYTRKKGFGKFWDCLDNITKTMDAKYKQPSNSTH
ncbi:uncharacterized protein LOC141856272 [Brevipalpus obovatus]|uniref:uncharacterized protein LOC141856272 n=1 Tax=Brevipalpus obovatus TaxID=246614 RepID=UPI003D9EFB1A